MELIVLICVATMLFYAIPGYILVKVKAIKENSISSFAKLLMYVCQPFLTIYAFLNAPISKTIGLNIFFAFVFSSCILLFFLLFFCFIFRKKQEDIQYRIFTLSTTFSNCLFIGLPLIEATLKDARECVLYANMFFLSMSLIGWTLGSYIISHDKKYIKIKNMILNPAVISLVIAFILYISQIKLPDEITTSITLLGKMSTPLCMLILGMRLATVPLKEIFFNLKQYLVILINQVVMPFIAFAILYFIPLETNLKITLILLCATPIASVVLNYTEMIGQGQKEAANLVLLGTLLSIGTIPLVSLLIRLI